MISVTQRYSKNQIETSYKGFPVVTLRQIKNASIQTANFNNVKSIGVIITEVAGKRVDGLPLKTISEIVASAQRPLSIKFRDPSLLVSIIPRNSTLQY